MPKKQEHLEELREYQQKQYLPHTHHIQGGELPFPTRQLMKQGAKKYILLILLALPVSLIVPVALQSRLALSPEVLGTVAALWAVMITAALALIIGLDMRRRAKAGNKPVPGKKNKKKR